MINANFKGIPQENLTWKEVFDMNLSISFGDYPKFCPKCGTKLKEHKSDYQKIENSGQYMVQGIYCPEGDFTYLECA